MSQSSQIWNLLLDKGLVSGSEPEQKQPDSPWYVKTLLAFSGWLASIFVFAFLVAGFSGLLNNSLACIIVGSGLIISAFMTLSQSKSEFFEHIGLACSLAGQALVVIAIFDLMDEHKALAWAVCAVFQLSLSLVMPNFIHRVFSSFFSAASFSISLSFGGSSAISGSLVMLVCAWLWLNEFKYPQKHKMLVGIGYGLTLSMIHFKGSALFGGGSMGWVTGHTSGTPWIEPWLGEALNCGVLLYVVWQVLTRYSVRLASPVAVLAIVATLVISGVSMEAKGIATGMMIITLGFLGSNRTLLGLGVLSLLFYFSSYYYFLEITLLAKAQILFIAAVALLVLRWILVKSPVWKQERKNA